VSFFNKRKRTFRISLFLIFAGLPSFCPVTWLCWASSSHGTEACLPVFSIEVQKKPLGAVIKDISKVTGYGIEINESWKNAIVTATLRNVDLEEGLKIISRKAGIKSYAFVVDTARKAITIYTIPELTSSQMEGLLETKTIPPPEEILSAKNLKSKSPNGTMEEIPPPPDEILNLRRPKAKSTHEDAETLSPPPKEILRAQHPKGKSANESMEDIPPPPDEILNLKCPKKAKRTPGGEKTIPPPPEEILKKRTSK
jgi:hypothetical protein